MSNIVTYSPNCTWTYLAYAKPCLGVTYAADDRTCAIDASGGTLFGLFSYGAVSYMVIPFWPDYPVPFCRFYYPNRKFYSNKCYSNQL